MQNQLNVMGMGVKVFFIGNAFGSDDGIGPHLYSLLKDDSRLKHFELMELGVIGFDLLSYIEENDKVIIVDAVKIDDTDATKAMKYIGDITIIEENELQPSVTLVSQHDFGVEETAVMMRKYMPNLKRICVVGIKVTKLQPFGNKLSATIHKKIDTIKEDVVKNIIKIANE
jgi:hydrogenase maturation protease